jgi:two-component system response regulator
VLPLKSILSKTAVTLFLFLRRQKPYTEAAQPDIIVLDLNLPLKNGREVLQELSDDLLLKHLPIAILTTSDSETHLCQLFPAGQCLYFVKQFEFFKLVEIVRMIADHAGTCLRN